ncbi:MAG: hypothetical protein HQL44_00780 [Alphaproteobacteria bacterium]|nr:hypothetical protein [Alphaproteobacteria bacterium]
MRVFASLAAWAERASLRIGDAASWLLLAVAGAGIAVLLLRHLLGSGEVSMPPAYVWCTALVMLAGSGVALKTDIDAIFIFRVLSHRARSVLLIGAGLGIVLPWALLLDLFAGSLSLAAPGLIGEPSGLLESLWWRLAIDVGALALGLEALGLFSQGLAGLMQARQS